MEVLVGCCWAVENRTAVGVVVWIWVKESPDACVSAMFPAAASGRLPGQPTSSGVQWGGALARKPRNPVGPPVNEYLGTPRVLRITIAPYLVSESVPSLRTCSKQPASDRGHAYVTLSERIPRRPQLWRSSALSMQQHHYTHR